MTSILLRALAILLSLATPALADGRADWTFYAWQQIKAATCLPRDGILVCPPYRQKWDWKRNQWVDIAIEIDPVRGELRLTQTLTDNDPRDYDWVCVTVIAVDAAGRNILAHHQNWQMFPGEVTEASFTYRSDRLDTLAAIHIGSKQCRDGQGQDDALYARVLAGIQP